MSEVLTALREEMSARYNVTRTEAALNLLSCSRHMERIADLSTNIAEDVLFMVEGKVMRHMG